MAEALERRRRVPRAVRRRRARGARSRRWRPTASCSRCPTPTRRSIPTIAAQVRGRGGHRPQRLPEPDQQRAGLPGCVPRRAGRRRAPDHREDEGRCRRGDLRGGRRRPRSSTTSCRARWTRGSGPPWPRRSRRPSERLSRPIGARRLASRCSRCSSCGARRCSDATSAVDRGRSRGRPGIGAAGPPLRGSAAVLRQPPRMSRSVPDPLAGLDSGDARCRARVSPAGCWTPSCPARRRVPPLRSTATWCRHCPKASPRATTPTSAEDKPALAVTEATADAWGGRDVTAAVRNCDKLKVGQVVGAPRPDGGRHVQAADGARISRRRNAFRRAAGRPGQRRVDVDRRPGHPRRRGGAGRPHVADPGRERGAAVPAQRADRDAGAGAQRGGRRAGHRRAGRDARDRSPTGTDPRPRVAERAGRPNTRWAT